MPSSITSHKNQSIAHFKAVLADPESYAMTLLTVLIDTYGAEAINWAPETIRRELEDDFGLQLPRVNADKLMAGIVLLTTDDFYQRLPRFIQLCNILAGTEADPDTVFAPADAAECAWGMAEAMLINPPDGDEPYSEEIRYYLGKILDDEGITNPPDLLKLALHDTSTGAPNYSDMSLDDPTMFQAEFANQLDRSKEITEMLQENLSELMLQLSRLPLNNGTTKNIAELARKHLSQ